MFVSSCPDMDNQILSFLTPQDLCRSCLVNKKWKERASNNYLWSHFFLRIRIPKGKSIKAHYDKRGIIALSVLINRVTEFSKKVKENENGELFCYFPQDTKCYFSAKIINNHKKDKSQVRECYWFLGVLPVNQINIRDVITIGENHTYIVHTRFPKMQNIKIMSERMVAIIANAC